MIPGRSPGILFKPQNSHGHRPLLLSTVSNTEAGDFQKISGIWEAQRKTVLTDSTAKVNDSQKLCLAATVNQESWGRWITAIDFSACNRAARVYHLLNVCIQQSLEYLSLTNSHNSLGGGFWKFSFPMQRIQEVVMMILLWPQRTKHKTIGTEKHPFPNWKWPSISPAHRWERRYKKLPKKRKKETPKNKQDRESEW